MDHRPCDSFLMDKNKIKFTNRTWELKLFSRHIQKLVKGQGQFYQSSGIFLLEFLKLSCMKLSAG